MNIKPYERQGFLQSDPDYPDPKDPADQDDCLELDTSTDVSDDFTDDEW